MNCAVEPLLANLDVQLFYKRSHIDYSRFLRPSFAYGEGLAFYFPVPENDHVGYLLELSFPDFEPNLLISQVFFYAKALIR